LKGKLTQNQNTAAHDESKRKPHPLYANIYELFYYV